MFDDFFSKLEAVHIVTTKEERQALYKHRYQQYVEGLHFDIPDIDHKNKILKDHLDEEPNTVHLYVGTPDNMLGSLRLLIWPPGKVDTEYFALYSLQEIPHIQKLRCAELGRFMVVPERRGKLTFPSLACKSFELLANKYNIDIIFLRCRPGLIPNYRKIGFRPYRAPLPESPLGVTVPLLAITSDLEYQKSVSAVILPITEKLFGKGKRPCMNLQDFEPLLSEDNQLVDLSAGDIWQSFNSVMRTPGISQGLFDNMSLEDKKIILDGGIDMQVDAGTDIALYGKVETEFYFVLSGKFNVIINENVVAQIGKGEVFGEMAFFRPDSLRTATVKAVEKGNVLVLNRKFIDKLQKQNPLAAFQILFNLGRILSNRLADISNSARHR